jgi:hypothetical protein
MTDTATASSDATTPKEEVTADNFELIFGLPLEKAYRLALRAYKVGFV